MKFNIRQSEEVLVSETPYSRLYPLDNKEVREALQTLICQIFSDRPSRCVLSNLCNILCTVNTQPTSNKMK